MIVRRPLPPPPPEDPHAWPDRETMLADRAAALTELTRRRLAAGRLVLLWLTGLAAAVGWAAAGLAVRSLELGGLNLPTALAALVLAAVLLAVAGVGLDFWLRQGRVVRERLEAWADLARDPATDVRARARRRYVTWLVVSLALCAVGAWTLFHLVAPGADAGAGAAAGTVPGAGSVSGTGNALVPDREPGAPADADSGGLGGTVYVLGWSVTCLITGLLGVARSVGHQHWSERLLSAVPERWGGGAHR
ncbi:hypothetical protein ACWEJP_16830 [Streptomyces sp. NPDC004749]